MNQSPVLREAVLNSTERQSLAYAEGIHTKGTIPGVEPTFYARWHAARSAYGRAVIDTGKATDRPPRRPTRGAGPDKAPVDFLFYGF